MTNAQLATTEGVTVAAGLRFRLDEERIRDFLMGESLYGDPSLALRELYQNAVDACRLADARRRFLGLQPGRPEGSAPDITFEQGTDEEGRAFIDCVDTGAGMGVDEITHAFCQAGVRASDLTERQHELADFAAAGPPVELWLNSRFGIGVMSYFMVAEAVTLTTARLERDGTVGDLLTVHMPGAATSFDVISHGPAASAGTRVRLWLKSGAEVSAVTTLRDLVLVCSYSMRVVDERGPEHRWMPGELNRASTRLRLTGSIRVGSPGLWWTDNEGAVLADGIWAETSLRGMLVDLNGREAPKLTADRRKIADLDHFTVEAIAVRGADSAVEEAWDVVGTPGWLSMMTDGHAPVADAIVQAAQRRTDRRLFLHGVDVDIARSGYMRGDERSSVIFAPRQSLLRWRFLRLAAGGLYESAAIRWPRHSAPTVPVPAFPSDVALLAAHERLTFRGTAHLISPWFGSMASVYDVERHLRYPVQQIISRARLLGLELPESAERAPDSSVAVRSALSFSARAWPDGSFRPVQAFDVLQASWQLGLPPSAVLAELDERSIECSERCRTLDSDPPPAAVLLAASERIDGVAPWRKTAFDVPLRDILAAARHGEQEPSFVVGGLRSIGYDRLPELNLDGIDITSDDIVMLSRDLDGSAPSLRAGNPAPKDRLRRAAARLARPEVELADRFALFGVTFSDEVHVESSAALTEKQVLRLLGLSRHERKALKPRHRRAMSQLGDAEDPWLDPREPVSAWFVATRALGGQSIDRVLRDLRELGYTVEDPREVLAAQVD